MNRRPTAVVAAYGATMVDKQSIGFTYDAEKVLEARSNMYAIIVPLLI